MSAVFIPPPTVGSRDIKFSVYLWLCRPSVHLFRVRWYLFLSGRISMKL